MIRRLTSGVGPVVVRAVVELAGVTWWLEGHGDTPEQAHVRAERLVLLVASDPERYLR